ncbi:protein SGT1 homolog [Babylonia areolata]|uniref:protein SGT1 homolog n=1 Tax=Babylonia areolata TaxID=304850 RepID=UPI003FCF8FF1
MAAESFSKANDEYISENYKRAVELYTEAMSQDPNSEDALVNRAQAYLKLDQYEDAIQDCDKVLVMNSKNVKAYLRKGTALFYQQDYQKALDAFKEGVQLTDDISTFEVWIEKCEIKLNEGKQNSEESSADKTKSTASAPAPAPAPAPAKPKYDWYQTSTHVVVTLLQKNTKKEDLVFDTTDTMLKVHTKQPNGEDVNLEIQLLHPVMPNQTTAKVMTSKVEIKLKKAEGIQWTKLEGDGQKFSLKLPSAAPSDSATVAKYPSSSHYTRNWDKLEQEVKEEEKNEKLEGDAALNKLFQQIYADGSDEVKKAMMKSFSESSGTVLSTNWSEVGKEKVQVKPPDGVEYKTYEK